MAEEQVDGTKWANFYANHRVIVLGASRGLGREVARGLITLGGLEKLILVARKEPLLREIEAEAREQGFAEEQVEIFVGDMTRFEDQERITAKICQEKPHRIFSVAGGGPHGSFATKAWKDHLWAYQLNQLFPSRLLHAILSQGDGEHGCPASQLTFVGSDVAETELHPSSSSYAAAKLGLKSLVECVIKESPPLDLRWLSPGYMDTDLLPRGSWPRKNVSLLSPQMVAHRLLAWAAQVKEERPLNLQQQDWQLRCPNPPR